MITTPSQISNLKFQIALIALCFAINAPASLDIDTGPASNITRTSAMFYGSLVSTNATNPICWLFYGTGDGLTNAANWGASNNLGTNAVGVLSTNITGLAPASLHYYRFYSFDALSNSVSWGASSNFWTLSGVPTNQPAVSNVAVMAATNGTLRAPTNFFGANTNLMAQAGMATESSVGSTSSGLSSTQSTHTAAIAGLSSTQSTVVAAVSGLSSTQSTAVAAISGLASTQGTAVASISGLSSTQANHTAAIAANSNATVNLQDGTSHWNSAWQNLSSSTNWTWTSDGKAITLTAYTGPATVVIPEMLDGLPITTLANSLFSGNTTITSVSGANNVATVGEEVFYGCENLVSVSLPKATSLGARTFFSCTNLTTVSLPSVLTLETASFYDCPGLASVSLPVVSTINGYAFQGCTNLATVSIPEATIVNANSFQDCSNLVSVTFACNAPAQGEDIYLNAANVTNYVSDPTATGWSNTFGGRIVVRMPFQGYDASTNQPGLLPQLSGNVADVLRGDGTYGASSTAVTNALQRVVAPGSTNDPALALILQGSIITNSSVANNTQTVAFVELDDLLNSANHTNNTSFTPYDIAFASAITVLVANGNCQVYRPSAGTTITVDNAASTSMVSSIRLDLLCFTNSITFSTNNLVVTTNKVPGLGWTAFLATFPTNEGACTTLLFDHRPYTTNWTVWGLQ